MMSVACVCNVSIRVHFQSSSLMKFARAFEKFKYNGGFLCVCKT